MLTVGKVEIPFYQKNSATNTYKHWQVHKPYTISKNHDIPRRATQLISELMVRIKG
jgi:hypothetical protein